MLDMKRVKSALMKWINGLGHEVHNLPNENQDLSAIPFLNLKRKNLQQFWAPGPSWFTLGQSPELFSG